MSSIVVGKLAEGGVVRGENWVFVPSSERLGWIGVSVELFALLRFGARWAEPAAFLARPAPRDPLAHKGWPVGLRALLPAGTARTPNGVLASDSKITAAHNPSFSGWADSLGEVHERVNTLPL